MKRMFVPLAITAVLAAMIATGPTAAGAGTTGDAPAPVPTARPDTAQPFGPVHYIKHRVWTGETLFGRQNDWEPDVAADPNAPYVYVTTTRFGPGNAACKNCPVPSIVYRVSPDNGATWSPPNYLCVCQGGHWQYDPQIEVASDGTVYALFLQQWHEYLVTSTDHGATFGPPVDTTAGMASVVDNPWADHGFLTISDDGKDQYVAFNHGDSFVVASHDYGATWGTPVQTSPAKDEGVKYYYHYKGAVLPDGTVNIAATAVPRHPYASGIIRYYDLRSTDGGATWKQFRLDTFKEQPDCVKNRCRHDHLAGQANLAADGAGNLVMVYAGTRMAQNGQIIFVSRSSDEGMTWTSSKRVSPAQRGSRRVIASFPAVAGTGDGDFRLWWMDDRKNVDSWDTWYTRSSDAGRTWGTQVRISDATSGAGYKHQAGFLADYGDYGGIAIMSDGRTIATWGEGYSYWGPGGTWINTQPAP